MGDRVGMMRTSEGRLHIYVNNLDQGVAARYLPDQVYGMVDLYGMVQAVAIIDPACKYPPIVNVCLRYFAAPSGCKHHDHR